MSNEVEVSESGSFGPVRLVVSTVVLLGLLAAGYVWMFGVPEAMNAPAEAEGAPTAPAGDGDDSGGESVAAPPAMPVPVRTAVATVGDLVKQITATGNAEALRQVEIQAATDGVIMEIAVEEGDVVEAGDLLVRLDDAELKLALQRSREQLVNAVARFQQDQFMDAGVLDEEARQDLERLQQEVLEGLRSPEHFEELINDPRFDAVFETITREEVRAAQQNLQGNFASFAQAQIDLERATIRAPFGGQVANLEAVIGARVARPAALLTLIDADPIRLRVNVLESEAGLVRLGREARVLFAAYPTETFTGRIETISPVLDPETKTLEVTVRLRNPDLRLKPGMFARIELDTEIFEDRLMVPSSAVLLRDERPMLFVVRDGRSDWIYIRKGLENDDMVEVLEGVEAGDEVIVSGHYSLAHDAPVRVVEDDEALPDDR